jgi:hypothetical protein
MIRLFGIVTLLVLAVSAWCAEPVSLGGFDVTRIDRQNHRVFVAPAGKILTSRETSKRYINRLSAEIKRQFPEWGPRWAASFFSEPQFAAYKDDAQVLKAVQDGVWEKAYLAEYDNAKRLIVLTPMDPVTIRKYRVEKSKQE